MFTEQIYDSAIPEPRYPSEVLDIVGDAMQYVMFKKYDGAGAAQEVDAKINEAVQAANK